MKALIEYFEKVFYLDLRSLALFRIALGILIIADLVVRWPTLIEMYTEEGLFTQALSFEYYDNTLGASWNDFVWSLYWLSDSVIFAQAMFTVTAIAAFFLIIGKWTRFATIICWVLVASLHARNPLVTTSGDFFFKMILFWSIFLPLSARWSFDAKQTESNKGTTVCSSATIAYILQLFIIYFFPGIAKWNSTWFSGEAMSYVLRLDIYIREFGKALLENPELLAAASWLTLFAEIVLIWTLFITWNNHWFRLINMAVFFGFHIGIAFCLGIGIFPWICMVGWLPLLPSLVWPKESNDKTAISSNFDWANLSLPKLGSEVFCLATLALVLIWNVSNVEHPATRSLKAPLVQQLVYLFAIDQHFQMFGHPPDQNPWFVYEGRLKGGDQIDLWRKQDISKARPESGLEVFPNFHWRKLHRNALHPTNSFVRQALLNHAIEQWNDSNPDQPVIKARLICFREEIGPDYNNLNFYSDTWGNFTDQEKAPGSLFESFLKEQGDDISF